MRRTQIAWVVFLGANLIGATAQSSPAPTSPKEFVAVVQEAQSRIKSFIVDVNSEYRDTHTNELTYQSHCITRWKPTHSLIKVTNSTHDSSFEITRLWTKSLYEPHDQTKLKEGRVTFGPHSQAITEGWPVLEAWWLPMGMPWNWLFKDAYDMRVTRAGENLYCFDATIQSRHLSVKIDGSKGFIPVETTLFDPAGKLFSRHVAQNLEEVSPGLWFPKKITCDAGEIQITYLFNKVSLNVEIPRTDLQFVFPKGTRVDNEIERLSLWLIIALGIAVILLLPLVLGGWLLVKRRRAGSKTDSL